MPGNKSVRQSCTGRITRAMSGADPCLTSGEGKRCQARRKEKKRRKKRKERKAASAALNSKAAEALLQSSGLYLQIKSTVSYSPKEVIRLLPRLLRFVTILSPMNLTTRRECPRPASKDIRVKLISGAVDANCFNKYVLLLLLLLFFRNSSSFSGITNPAVTPFTGWTRGTDLKPQCWRRQGPSRDLFWGIFPTYLAQSIEQVVAGEPDCC